LKRGGPGGKKKHHYPKGALAGKSNKVGKNEKTPRRGGVLQGKKKWLAHYLKVVWV